jgi:hypothetical protein
MATKMRLVPEEEYSQITRRSTQPNPQQIVKLVEPESKNGLMDLVQFFPKNCKTKAKLLLSSISGKLTLNDQNRVLYPPNNDVGSNIIDLVKYFTSSFPMERPLDARRFLKLMENAGVPKSAISRKNKPTKWDMFPGS